MLNYFDRATHKTNIGKKDREGGCDMFPCTDCW